MLSKWIYEFCAMNQHAFSTLPGVHRDQQDTMHEIPGFADALLEFREIHQPAMQNLNFQGGCQHRSVTQVAPRSSCDSRID